MLFQSWFFFGRSWYHLLVSIIIFVFKFTLSFGEPTTKLVLQPFSVMKLLYNWSYDFKRSFRLLCKPPKEILLGLRSLAPFKDVESTGCLSDFGELNFKSGGHNLKEEAYFKLIGFAIITCDLALIEILVFWFERVSLRFASEDLIVSSWYTSNGLICSSNLFIQILGVQTRRSNDKVIISLLPQFATVPLDEITLWSSRSLQIMMFKLLTS